MEHKIDKALEVLLGTESNTSGITLYISPKAQKKMDLYVQLIAVEVGWMGFIRQVPRTYEDTGLILPSRLVLDDVFLYEQEVSGGSVDAEGGEVSKVLQQLIDEGKEELIPQLKFFAHSHANMTVHHSPRDVEMINDWASTGLDWFISHVQNKKGEVNCRFDMFTPFRVSAPVRQVEVVDPELYDAVVEEINVKVSKRTYTNVHQPWQKGSSKSTYTNDRYKNRSGKVNSKDAERNITDPSTRLDPAMGTVERPVVHHVKMPIDWDDGKEPEVETVRQEIVKGIIIHESVAGSPEARKRTSMTDTEKWAYYSEYMSANPSLTDPTPERLEAASRSTQRSDQKRLSPPSDQGSNGQTPTQKSQQKDSKDEQSESTDKKQGASNKRGSKKNEQKKPDQDNEKQLLTEEEQQQSLIVIEGEVEGDEPKSVEEQVTDELQKMGIDI